MPTEQQRFGHEVARAVRLIETFPDQERILHLASRLAADPQDAFAEAVRKQLCERRRIGIRLAVRLAGVSGLRLVVASVENR